MDNSTILFRLIELWKDITGVDPGQKMKSGTLRAWNIDAINKRVAEAQSADPTGFCALCALHEGFQEVVDDKRIPLIEILSDYDDFKRAVEPYLAFKEEYERPYVKEMLDEAVAKAENILRNIGADKASLKEFRVNPYRLAQVQVQAHRSFNTLHVFQFAKGQPAAPDSESLLYVKNVYQFNGLNDMLASMKELDVMNGISLCLIREPDPNDSHFVIGVKTGGNIFVLSDVGRGANPLYGQRTRRPGRHVAERVDANLFPYGLLEMNVLSNGDAFIAESKLPATTGPVKLAAIKDLPPKEVLWFVLLAELIYEKFIVKGHQEQKLSITGGMLQYVGLPEAQKPQTNALATRINRIEVPALTLESVKKKDAGAPKWIKESRGANDYLIDEFAEEIKACGDIYNVRSDGARLLPCQGKDWRGEACYQLAAMTAGTIGTEEELESDRLWLARSNLATIINRLLDEEYKTTINKVMEVMHTCFEMNRNRIMEAVAQGKTYDSKTGKTRDIIFTTKNPESAFYATCRHGISLGVKWKNRWTKTTVCAVNNSQAVSYYAVIPLHTQEELEFYMGKSGMELPRPLRHYTNGKTASYGNSILQCLDPMDSEIHNKWDYNSYYISVPLSKRGYVLLCREKGVAAKNLAEIAVDENSLSHVYTE